MVFCKLLDISGIQGGFLHFILKLSNFNVIKYDNTE